MLPRLPRGVRIAIVALAAVGAVWGLLGYRYHANLRCSACGAPMERVEAGLAVWTDRRAPFYEVVRARPEAAQIERFLPAGHAHRPGTRTHGWSSDGPFLSQAFSCPRRPDASGFVLLLEGNGPFADFLDARIADGTIDVATIRELLALPEGARESRAADPRRSDVLRKGNELACAFLGADPQKTDIWDQW